ncbi:uncharacterized protein LOC110620547 isoform X2 [Manihot esculenta]|uniref:uncharacterized protein LOC110620547 isoform X2 n=1 Tax=Manihot esculenta TaxID=3983 RepID=UPI001CC71B34|nr:uncharacterized protein LOC110620547 isoform X2 [Manihot esculenta]
MKAETIRQRSFNRINSSIGLIQLGRSGSDDTLMEEQYCIKEMQELHGYLDMERTRGTAESSSEHCFSVFRVSTESARDSVCRGV